MTLAVFHDSPGLEYGLTKFHDFPGKVVTLLKATSAHLAHENILNCLVYKTC